MRPLLAWLSALLLAACAAPATTWEKPGTGQAAVDQDLQQCRDQARLASPPSLRASSPASASATEPDVPEARELREAAQFQKCMREKGYSAKR